MNPPAYPIAFEVRGPLAMFADPASGSEAISHVIPPPSACKGIIHSIIRVMGVKINIVAVANCCATPKWVEYATNSITRHRKPDLIRSGQAIQIRESFLENPCFQILATLQHNPNEQVPDRFRSINCAHSMQAQFYRRLERNQSFSSVSLGRRELLADYVGKIETPIRSTFSLVIPEMVLEVFEDNQLVQKSGRVIIRNGVAIFDPTADITTENGVLSFA